MAPPSETNRSSGRNGHQQGHEELEASGQRPVRRVLQVVVHSSLRSNIQHAHKLLFNTDREASSFTFDFEFDRVLQSSVVIMS